MSLWRLRASTTALLLLLGCIVFVVIHDIATPPWDGLSDSELADISDGNFSSSLVGIAIFVVPSLGWHVADFWSQLRSRRYLASLILGYKAFFAVLVFGLAGTALVFSGLTENFYCRDSGPSDDGTFYTLCHPPLYYGIELFTFLPILIIIALTITKAIFVAIDKLTSNQ